MFQRDFILRQIEQIGVVLRALLRSILAGEADRTAVRAELRKVLQNVGFDLEIALIADSDTVIRMIAPTGELEPARGWLVAEAMYLDGLEAALDGRPQEGRRSLEKAFRLFQMFDAGTPIPSGFPEARERMAEIEQRLAALGAADGD
ncbi:MAG TPA: hypothetical protein VGA37_05820 [Gemmatimonadales bacterium]